MKTIYPYDPDANLASNRVTVEVDVNLYPNKYNVVVPETAPFYRLDLEVRDSNDRLLIEGLDYYLGYYSKEISEATGKPVYGGIMLFDAKQASVKLRAVGGNHMIPQSEIARFLTKPDLEEPRNVNWSELQRYPTAVTPVDKPDSLEEALEKDVVVKALDGVRQSILKKIGDLDAKYKDVIEAISLVADKIGDHDLWTHHKTPHEHKYTRAMLNSLGVDETAADAIKAYGLTLQEVVDEMVTFGINSARIDNLLNDTLNRTVKGRLNVSSTDDLILQHESGNAKITLDGGLFSMETTAGEIVFETDTDSNEAGIGLEIGAGYNVLLVPSAGGVKGGYPSFNGKILITVDNILNFLHKPTQATANVQSTSSETVEFRGRGVDTSPFQADAIPPHATVSTSGLWKVTDSLLMTGDGYGISQWAVTQIRDALAGYVPKTFTVNGVEFGSDEIIILTKSHIGLSNAQNTGPSEKPVTTALTNATKNKSLSNHTHNKSDLTGIPYADHDTEGLAALHNTIDNTANKAATPKIGNDLMVLIDDVEEDVAGRVKAGAASATHYGGDGYLPVPVLGNYGHANYSYPAFYGEEDKNNKFVCLFNYRSDFGNGVFYHEIQLNASGKIVTHNKSSVEYTPKFLTDLGRKASAIYGGNNGVMCIRDDASTSWVVLTNGTMDYSKHQGAPCTNLTQGRDYKYVIHGQYVYCVWASCSSNVYWKIYRAPIEEIRAGKPFEFEIVNQRGNDMYGNAISTDSPQYAPLAESTDENAQSYAWRNDGGKWSGRNYRHSAQNWDLGLDGDELHIYLFQKSYFSNSTGSSWGGDQTTETIVNLTNYTFRITDPEHVRIVATTGGMRHYNPNTAGKAFNKLPNIDPNRSTSRVMGKNFLYTYSFYGTHNPMYLNICKRPDGASDGDLCGRWDVGGNASTSSANMIGPTPSPVASLRSHPAWLDNETIIYEDLVSGWVKAKVDPNNPYPNDNGLGPTTDRVKVTAGIERFTRIPRVWNGSSSYNWGYVGAPEDRMPLKLNSALGVDAYGVFKDPSNTMRDRLRDEAISRGTLVSDRLIHGGLFLHVFGNPASPIAAFVVYRSFQYIDANKDRKGVQSDIYKVNIVISGENITITGTPTYVGYHRHSWGTSTAAHLTSSNSIPQPFTYVTADGRRGFVLSGCGYYSYVGNGGRPDFNLMENGDGTYWHEAVTHYTYQFHNLWGYHPKFGFYECTMSAAADAAKGVVRGFQSDDIKARTVLDTVYILATRAAEGWIVYFTQDLPFYANQTLYNVPATSFDLRTLYPSSHANRTFYIHVDVSTGTPKYTIDEEKKPDTATRLWIGHVKTDSERVIELVAERARRLGSIATLIQHEHNKYAHGYDYTDTLLSSEYSLLENKGMVHDFNVVSFKDIFNTWYRFSHNSSGNYPANSSELNNWQYVEKYDCVECTINSGTFIGFISDEMAGDYVFNTVVSSYNGDDDGIFVMLGAFKQGDVDSKEHTLALQVNTGGFGTTTPYVCLIKDHTQAGAERIATLDAASDGSGAGTGWMESNYYEVFHIWAKRVKNELLIYVDRKQLPTSGVSLADYELKVSNYVNSVRNLREADFEQRSYLKANVNLSERAPMFARPTRFGYGAQSQHLARFWNIERPLSNLNEFYSSEQMLLESMAKNDGVYRKFSGQTLRSAVGDKYAGNNYTYLSWANAVVNRYAGSTSGNYARPHPSAQYISPTRVYNPPGNREFIVKKKLNIKTNSVRIVATADDELRGWIGNVAIGQVGSATQTTTNHSVIPGEQVFTFACKNVPANSSAHCAFAIYDGNELVAVSDTSWKCYEDVGGYNNVKVAEISYLIDANTRDVFSLNAKVSGYGVAPREYHDPIYQLEGQGIKVKRYVDVSKGDIDWDVVMIKNPL